MSKSAQTNDKEETVTLNIIGGAADEQNNTCNQANDTTGRIAGFCCNDEHYRRLAHCSIICGCSCIGIQALETSLKAERTTDRDIAAKLSKRSRYLSIASIVTFFAILLSLPLLTLLISYLITLKE